jgi:hypothetical protein
LLGDTVEFVGVVYSVKPALEFVTGDRRRGDRRCLHRAALPSVEAGVGRRLCFASPHQHHRRPADDHCRAGQQQPALHATE